MVVNAPAQRAYPWGLLLLEGIISVAFGLALLFLREPTLQLVIWLLGLYLIASSILAFWTSLFPSGAGRRRWLFTRGTLTLLVGLFLLSDRVIPGIAISDVALLSVAIGGVLIGLVGLIHAASGAGLRAAALGALSIGIGYYVWRFSPALFFHFTTVLGVVIVVGGGATVVLAVRMGLRAGTDNPIKVRHPVLGMLRVIALLVIMLVGLALAFPAWLIPVTYSGMKLNYWVVTYTCRAVNWVLRIEVQCDNRQLLLDHTGIVFPNHLSYLDIPALVSLEPMRFLSTAEVFRVPFLGWMADSITTIFVDRSSEKSRMSVREQIARRVTKDANPPFVIFAEGRFGTESSLQPYHRGAFEIAAQNSIPYLPCAIQYSRPDIALWRGAKEENFVVAVWRVLTFRGRMHVCVTPLQPTHPVPSDDAVRLAADTQRATEAALGYAPGQTTLTKA